jgi:hypothetical protein
VVLAPVPRRSGPCPPPASRAHKTPRPATPDKIRALPAVITNRADRFRRTPDAASAHRVEAAIPFPVGVQPFGRSGLDLSVPMFAPCLLGCPGTPVPGQQSGRGHDPVQPRTGNLPAQHRDLMPQYQYFHVLRCVTACQQHQPTEHPDHEQVDEADNHSAERRPAGQRDTSVLARHRPGQPSRPAT